ncbi:unnamed protein product [Paramecium pentaurelia]|uniref:Uncharacterized protein n=1 Tax=Paramecium pentaurelia TaxID=43138 RepID=A0A8S1YI55_9CILI|nr:unnamed protein product [Paramecium pentaurelia]
MISTLFVTVSIVKNSDQIAINILREESINLIQECQQQNGIRNKNSLQKERLEYLNSQKINDFLNSIIQLTEYLEQIITNISEYIKKLNNSFNYFYQQQQQYIIQYKHLFKYKLIRQDYCIKSFLQQRQLLQYHRLIQICSKLQIIYLDGKQEQGIEIIDKPIQSDLKNHLFLWYKVCGYNHYFRQNISYSTQSCLFLMLERQIKNMQIKGICF